MKKNIVRATGLTGIYKDKQIEVRIGNRLEDCKVLINKKEVKNCAGIWIKCVPDKPTSIFLEFIKQ